jgi:ATP-binding cassette subfamily B (MDR/TAP) protein 1
LSLEAHKGKTVALVGKSGCGKSTAIAIAERFYDVDHGSAEFDDRNVKEWNLRFMRRQMALVGQEPGKRKNCG